MATDDVLGPPPYLRSKWWYLQDAPNVAPTTIGPAPESLTADSTTREITAFYLQHALNQYHTIDECKRLIDERQTKTAIVCHLPTTQQIFAYFDADCFGIVASRAAYLLPLGFH